MPQLDGLRCYAVLLVMWSHAVGGWPRELGPLGLGIWAVWLFFVLSGFLITGILLRARDASWGRRGHAWRAFYARRVLRIFPLYYLVLAITATAGVGHSFRADLPWHLAYLGNWRMAWHPASFQDPAGPVWSLAVEEQFYLVWPALVLFAPRERLARIFAALAVAGLLSREVAVVVMQVVLHTNVLPSSVLLPTPSNLDPLALGALLAWARHAELAEARRRRLTRSALTGGLALGIALTLATLANGGHGRTALVMLAPVAVALVSVWLVDRAADGFAPGTIGERILGNRSARYVGTISYGVYLWHYPLLWTLAALGAFAGVRAGATGNLTIFSEVLALTLVVASASWYLYERPINRLKRRFAYAKPADTSPALGVQPPGPDPEPGRPWPGAMRAALDGDALPAAGRIED